MNKAVLIACAAAALLSACGHRGELQRPAPWWGPDERTDEERAHETEDEKEQAPAEQPQR